MSDLTYSVGNIYIYLVDAMGKEKEKENEHSLDMVTRMYKRAVIKWYQANKFDVLTKNNVDKIRVAFTTIRKS